ncbi:formylglycine-generating enzyme family protein [Fusobacterium canifelinum]|uniref:formylglycine-generating enzyme family protein n=1 Tax=Fusobacterium canifelinum TaxID=285729 RepID=UPI0030D1A000
MKNKEIELKNFEDEYMVKVKSGRYTPSFVNEEKEVFDIEVCKYPTTQLMWLEVMKNNPSEFKGENKPVETVTWWDTLEYCNRLSEKYGLKPVYNLSQKEKGILRIIHLDGEIVEETKANFKNTEGFRLPTEIEWEWFAKGGQVAIEQGTFEDKYSGSNNVDEVAWSVENSDYLTHDVGLKKPNQLGLYDCSGNVWEWCYDIYDISKSQEKRILRGGSWDDMMEACVTFYHVGYDNSLRHKGCGFRVVKTI